MIEITTTETAAVVVVSAAAVAAFWRNGVSAVTAVMASPAFSGSALRTRKPVAHTVPATGLFRADADVYGTPQSRGSCW